MHSSEKQDPAIRESVSFFIRTLLPVLGKYRLRFIAMIVSIMIQVVFALSIPIALKLIMDHTLSQKNIPQLWYVLTGLAVAFCVNTLAEIWHTRLVATMMAELMKDIRALMFQMMQKLPIKFYDSTPAGELMSRFTNDLTAIELTTMRWLRNGIYFVLCIILCISLLFFLEWRLTLLTLLIFPISAIIPHLMGRKATTTQYGKKQCEAQLANLVQENIKAQKIIRAFSLQKNQFSRFNKSLSVLYEKDVQANLLAIIIGKLSGLASYFVIIGIIGAGSFLVIQDRLTQGDLIGFLAVLMNLTMCIMALADLLPELLLGISGMQRVGEFFNENDKVSEGKNLQVMGEFETAIEFSDVDFSYTGEEAMLQKVTLVVRAGQTVAFVGCSGSGKSTLFNLLLRFYEFYEGDIWMGAIQNRSKQPILAQGHKRLF